jgi:ABC-type antimicrobial peptide transport system permease subunit
LPGIVLGVGISLVSTRLLESMPFGATRTDPLTQALGIPAVLAAAMVASIVPAARAARVDPTTSLRPVVI